jgi:hypothetical protein
MKKYTTRQIEAREQLLKNCKLKPSDTLIIFHRSVSRSGMLRKLGLFLVDKKTSHLLDITNLCNELTGYVGKDIWNYRAVGCGMDMHFATADNLTYALWPNRNKLKTFKGNNKTCLNWQSIF